MHVQCLLWDFGDTLCDELSLWRVSPEWMEVYRSFDDGLGAAWSLGDLDTRGFVAELARRMPLTEVEILAHLTRTDLFKFFPFTYAFFRSRHLPQAIVTVNPALFSEVVVAGFAFEEITDAIVVSGEERTIDKGELCRRALERMNLECDPSRALLIDNKQSNLDAWAERGGIGYLYTTDGAFRRDVAGGVDGLIQRQESTARRGSRGLDVKIGELERKDLRDIWSIDRAEVVDRVYYREDGELVLKPERHDVQGWPPGEPERYGPILLDCFDHGGTFYGAFDGETLIGATVLESRFIGREKDQLQLKFLHVSRRHREAGLGRTLFEKAVAKARELGGRRLYISATPSENTVRFYLRRGCRVTDDVDAALFKLEPEDIHLEFDVPV